MDKNKLLRDRGPASPTKVSVITDHHRVLILAVLRQCGKAVRNQLSVAETIELNADISSCIMLLENA